MCGDHLVQRWLLNICPGHFGPAKIFKNILHVSPFFQKKNCKKKEKNSRQEYTNNYEDSGGHSMMMVPENWSSLKREATTLENYIETRLHKQEMKVVPPPSTMEHMESGSASVHPGLVRLHEIDESLGKLSGVVERLGAMASTAGSSVNAANAAVAQRFRDVLSSLRQEHRAQSNALSQRIEAAALLGSSSRDPGGPSRAGVDNSADAALLRERGSLQGHGRAIDDLLAQAAETTDALRSQRDSLMSSSGRLGGFLTRLPGATQLMGAISNRKSRNDTIVYLVIAACVCYTVWHLFLRKY